MFTHKSLQSSFFALLGLAATQGQGFGQIIARPVAPAPPPAPAAVQAPPRPDIHNAAIRSNVMAPIYPQGANFRGPNAAVYGYSGGYFPFYSPYYSAYDYGGAYYGNNGVNYPNGYDFDYDLYLANTYAPPPPRTFATPPPLANDHPDTARLALQVPNGAEVWLQGKKYDIGSNRTFESPELKPGETFVFDVRVVWTEKGKKVEEKRTLRMKAGDFQSLQYMSSDSTPPKIEKLFTSTSGQSN